MEPRHKSIDQLAGSSSGGEGVAPVGGHEVDRIVGSGIERQSVAVEQRPADQPDPAGASIAPVPILPAPIPKSSSDDSTVAVSDDAPIVAADEELIEKEWVDKAKQIIASTKDDPYSREVEIKKLQIDYVKKRYGRIIGDAGSKDGDA